jgi:hypothetical protein
MKELSATSPKQLTGNEFFQNGPENLNISLLAFWQWGFSDITNNTTRGILAEFIVAHALECKTQVRETWDSYDLITPQGVKVEVKSASYLQSWYQKKLSTIQFKCPKTIAWDAQTNTYQSEKERQADIYIFAVFTHKVKSSLNPLDVSQSEFYVITTQRLNEIALNQKTITLNKLRRFGIEAVPYSKLRDVVTQMFP